MKHDTVIVIGNGGGIGKTVLKALQNTNLPVLVVANEENKIDPFAPEPIPFIMMPRDTEVRIFKEPKNYITGKKKKRGKRK